MKLEETFPDLGIGSRYLERLARADGLRASCRRTVLTTALFGFALGAGVTLGYRRP